MQLPKGVIHNPKRTNRPYGVMVGDVWFYHATVEEAMQRQQGITITLLKTKPERKYWGWCTRRVQCTICKNSVGAGRIKAHEAACKKRAEGYKYVRPSRRIRKRETVRGTHFDSFNIFMEYQGEERSLNEIAKMTGTPLDTLRHRYKRKTMPKTIEYLFGPITPAEQYTQRTYKKKEVANHEQISES